MPSLLACGCASASRLVVADPGSTRIAGQPRGGEILASCLVREIVESRGDLVVGPTREAELKGRAGAHRLPPILRETVG